MSNLVDILNSMIQLHTESANYRIDIYDLCEDKEITAYKYNKWLKELHKVKKSKTVSERLKHAAIKVLGIEPYRRGKGRLMRYAPINKVDNDNCLGYRKGALVYMGQLVRATSLLNDRNHVEIVEDYTGEYCGVVNKSLLVPVDGDVQERIRLAKDNMVKRQTDKIMPEIEEKSRIIKFNNELIKARKKANQRMEKEMAAKRKIEREEKKAAKILPMGDLSKLNFDAEDDVAV